MPDDLTEVLILPPEVRRRCGGVRQSTIWRWMQSNDFPKPVWLNPNGTRIAWREHEVNAWIANREQGLGVSYPAALAALRARYAADRAARAASPRAYHFIRRAPLPPGADPNSPTEVWASLSSDGQLLHRRLECHVAA